MKNRSQILRQKQKELIDEFILDTEKISKIMGVYHNKMANFHRYSVNNLLLAHFQMLERNDEGIELLAPYRRWETIGRNVKKGEKALYILAPIKKTIRDEETDEIIEVKTYFKSVPVFDLSQTEGEPIEEDYTVNHSNITFEEVKNSIKDIEIFESEKQLTKGYTDGKSIHISKHLSDTEKICVLFHELAHYKLHFNKDRKELTSATKELEAESVSFMVSSALGITNHESGAYITNWAGENSHEIIKGKGEKLIKTANQIIDNYGLMDLITITDDEDIVVNDGVTANA